MITSQHPHAWFVEQAMQNLGSGTRFLGIRMPDIPSKQVEIQVGGQTWQVVPVRSTLQARRALAQACDGGRCLLLTPLGGDELGAEVVMRLGYERLESPQPWKYVREMFRARRVDPRLLRQTWIADYLLKNRPMEGYPPAQSGMLGLDLVWDALAGTIGLPSGQPSVSEILLAVAEGLGARWPALPVEFRIAAAEWWGDRVGAVLPAMVLALDAGRGEDLVSLGLVFEILASEQLDPELRGAMRAHLESKVGVPYPTSEVAREWADRSRRWCEARAEEGGDGAYRRSFERADSILKTIGGTEASAFSSMLSAGWVARRKRFAATILKALSGGSFQWEDDLKHAHKSLGDHFFARHSKAQESASRRSQNALRLTRWLATPLTGTGSLEDFSVRYRDDGAWVDRARYALTAGESDSDLKEAYSALLNHVTYRRQAENEAFATRLARFSQGEVGAGSVRFLENTYTEVVAPLAERVKVLVVVMDGMSQAVYQQIAEDLGHSAVLQRMAPMGESSWQPVLAPLPTVTEVCRASLFSGKLCSGGQGDEEKGVVAMASHHGWSKKKKKTPLLFHKGTLRRDGGGSASAVGAAIEGDDRVVSVVINAVDDLLPKGDQLKPDWSLQVIPDLEEVVFRAQGVGRAIVLTADHGHVVDLELSGKEATEEERSSERWRGASQSAREGEIEVRGSRVVLPVAGGPVVLPWSETVRYSGRHSGYHGGIAPQEAVVPFGVFVPSGACEEALGDEWGPEAVVEPAWWSGTVAEIVETDVTSAAVPKPKGKAKSETQTPSTFAAPEPIAQESSRDAWLDALFSSEVYEGQQTMAGRQAPKEAEIEAVLIALRASNGTLTFDSLRNHTRMVERRLRSFLVPLARVLNVDGVQVLHVDATSRTVSLNSKLLATQFDIEVS